ncbi:MAG: hypothetical protein MJY61_05115 [Bacteroidales bacterium]|nr:hypothetical protein [Bacteroidales bacterium]
MKKKRYIRLYQDIDSTYLISGDKYDYNSPADEICNADPSNGSMFCIVVPGLYEWHNRFVAATDFADTKTRDDFNWALWHRDGLLFAKEIQRQLPRDFTLIYDHPFEDKSGLIDEVNMETDDVDSIISELPVSPGTASGTVRKDNVACNIERNGDFLDARLSIGRFSTTVRFRESVTGMRFLRAWMERIVKGDNDCSNVFVTSPDVAVELILFPQHVCGHSEMGQFWVREEGNILPEFYAYVNKREFVRTLYLSFMTKLGFYIYRRDDGAEELSPSEKFEKYYRPYNELKSDIIEWFITDELYFKKKMPLDEGAHCVTEPLVMYNDYGHAIIWNARDACCNHEDECICCDHQVININVPGLLDWTGEYDSETIEDFEGFWNDGWILAKKLRRQLPPNVDLYYMSFDTSNPLEKIDYACRYPKIIVPLTEFDEAGEQLSKVYEKTEPIRFAFLKE